MSLLVLGCDLEEFLVYVCCADGVGEHDGSSLALWVGRWEVMRVNSFYSNSSNDCV